jgi:hypothetical protein
MKWGMHACFAHDNHLDRSTYIRAGALILAIRDFLLGATIPLRNDARRRILDRSSVMRQSVTGTRGLQRIQ